MSYESQNLSLAGHDFFVRVERTAVRSTSNRRSRLLTDRDPSPRYAFNPIAIDYFYPTVKAIAEKLEREGLLKNTSNKRQP